MRHALEVGLLQGKKGYRWGSSSRLFPGLDMAGLSGMLLQAADLDKLAWSRKFRRWVKKNKPGAKNA